MQRVMVYVDGFNLYYGLRARGWWRYYWLDLHRLSVNLLQTGQELMGVRYFTARVSPEPGDSDKPARQNAYLETLATLPDLHIHYGYYMAKTQRCLTCGSVWNTHRRRRPGRSGASCPGALSAKRTVVAFPPGRHSEGLRSAATAYLTIGRDACRDSQLPEQVVKPDGFVLTRPLSWN